MSIYFRTNLSQLAIFLSISLLFSVQAIGFNVDIDGVLNQKTLSIEEGAILKIKTETYK